MSGDEQKTTAITILCLVTILLATLSYADHTENKRLLEHIAIDEEGIREAKAGLQELRAAVDKLRSEFDQFDNGWTNWRDVVPKVKDLADNVDGRVSSLEETLKYLDPEFEPE